MTKIFALIALLLLVLLGILAANTLRMGSSQQVVTAVAGPGVDIAAAAARLGEAIRFRTISDPAPAGAHEPAFDQLIQFLERAYPRVHATLVRERVGHSLLFTWQGTAPGLEPILLLAHTDVVPAPAATETLWTHPPFAGRIAGGYIWGRGSLDDKAAALAMLEAAEQMLGAGFRPARTVYFAFGHDEEVGGRSGAARVAALLQQRGVTFQFVLDEGLLVTEGIVPAVASPVALVGIAEKGYVSVELVVESSGGHASMPPRSTAAGILGGALARLEANPMRARLSDPVERMFAHLGGAMAWPARVVVANRWLFRRLLLRQLARAPSTDAMIRTTTAPTMLQGAARENVLPARVRGVVNFRILPGDTIAGVLEHVRTTIDDARVHISALTDTSSEPSPVASTVSPGFTAISTTIRQVFHDVLVAPALVIPATDSRHFQALSDDVYRFAPVRATSADLARFHGVDERIALVNYEECITFYHQLILNAAAGRTP